MNLHSIYLPLIKKEIKASFVGFERTGDNYVLKVIKNKVPKFCPLTGTPDDISAENYSNLLNGLKDFYEQI